MNWNDIAEVEESIRILIDAELEIHHRLEGHQRPLGQCPVCRALTTPFQPDVAS